MNGGNDFVGLALTQNVDGLDPKRRFAKHHVIVAADGTFRRYKPARQYYDGPGTSSTGLN
jgi:hypothetical protein